MQYQAYYRITPDLSTSNKSHGCDIRFDLLLSPTFMLASSSQATSSSDFVFVSILKIGDAPPNTHIFWLDPSETHRGYGCHAFHPSGRRILDKQAVPVIYHQGSWNTLRHKAGNAS